MISKHSSSLFETNPRKLFVLDGLGALLSAFLLGVVLVRLESIFGIPPATLYILAAIPIFFALYDLYSYLKGNKLTQLLRGIAIMNLMYCILSIGFAFHHSQQITVLGWGYIILEVIIVAFIAFLELKVAKKLSL